VLLYHSDNLCLFEVEHSKLFCLKWNIQILLQLELHTMVRLCCHRPWLWSLLDCPKLVGHYSVATHGHLLRATPTVLQILFGKCCYLLTSKMIWGGNKNDISKCLTILTWQKQNSTNFEDQQRSIRLSACYKNACMQNAKSILGVHKCQDRRRICQLAINVKPNCQTVG